MYRSLNLFVLVILGSLLCTQAHAQEIGFTASVDRSSIATGEYVKLTITLTNSKERFEAPSFGGLLVAQGPFDNSSFNYINGRMSSSISRTWVLTQGKPGQYTIGAAKARVGGGIIQTEPITIEVVQGATGRSDPNATQGQSRDPNLFATITLSKNKAYVGEQVVATYMLYSRYANIEPTKYELPKMDGFWAEEVDFGDATWEDQLQTVNGVQYRVALLKRQVLFAQRSGKLRVAPLQMSCIVNRSFFNRGTALTITSNSVEFTAMALPPAPADYIGAVGELTMDVKADRTSVKANEAITLTILFTGKGNLKLLDAPELDFPNDFETYDPKVLDKINLNAGGMSGSRQFEYLVIPRNEGDYPLAPITFSYFDTRTGNYRSLSTAPLTIQVGPGEGGGAAVIQRPTKSDVDVLGKDIRYIRTGDLALRPNGDHLFGSLSWIAGMGAPALAFVLFLGWQRKRDAARADLIGTRRKQADRVARKRLAEAEDALRGSDRSTFYNAMGKALHGYVADKFALGQAETTAPFIRERFSAFQGGDEVASAYVELIEVCDMARFAPVEDRPRQDLYNEAVAVIGRAEQLVRT